ncbi:MAG TPA: TRAP transporter large permease [Phycisphaerae bacterium]|nr:TRAP transporter large permease [Phycisphaerae bacterium]HSA25867.1 TRAP transporter large permease [Phycisphaerae bacterium]
MSDPVLGLCAIGIMVVAMLVSRMPAAFVMAIIGFVGIAVVRSPEAAMGILRTEVWTSFSKQEFTVIPMFILVGEFIFYAGYNDRLFHATYTWAGHRRGGLAIATMLACAGFSAICGSNTATAATMSAVAIPSMKRYNYHAILRAGAVAAGSTLGVMIPPSIVLVVYGLYTGQSIGKLFVGTLIPGGLLTVFLALTVVVICRRHPDWGPEGPNATWGERLRCIPDVLDILVLFLVIMSALLSGFVTATEAAAVGCTLGLLFCLLRRRLSWHAFTMAVYDTLRISCLVFMILVGATLFGRFMNVTGLPDAVAQWIGGLAWPSWAVLLTMLLCYLVGGCFMDALAFLLISLPIFSPLVAKMGYDPVWFGEVICLVTTLGAITPPVGISCFVVAGMSKEVPMEQVFKGAMYYLPAYIITFLLMLLSPYWTVLALSNLAR